VAERALVIIPSYNEAVNLPHIVPQVLAQDPRLEVLVVDDNSPDGTGLIADEMAQANPRVHVLHREGKLGLGETAKNRPWLIGLFPRRPPSSRGACSESPCHGSSEGGPLNGDGRMAGGVGDGGSPFSG